MTADAPHIVHLAPAARHDLRAIWEYTIDRWSAQQAEEYLARFDGVMSDLSRNPGMGRERAQLGAGIRSFPIGRHVLIYRIDPPDRITILRVRHASEDWQPA